MPYRYNFENKRNWKEKRFINLGKRDRNIYGFLVPIPGSYMFFLFYYRILLFNQVWTV